MREIVTLWPWVRIVCMSAWMVEPLDSIALRADASAVLQKPFKLAAGAGVTVVDPHGGIYEQVLANYFPARARTT